MVYYPVKMAKLVEMIDSKVDRYGKTWSDRAKILAQQNIGAGKLAVKKPTWSDIKAIYARIQGNKCAYCELDLGGPGNGHVEHYRPKAKVTKWPGSKGPRLGFATGDAGTTGYYWLAYDPMNYAVSCAQCNSSCKGNAFPIAGSRVIVMADVATLNAKEQPLLLMPFGEWGDDPAAFIEYEGITARPIPGLLALNTQRAQVTIEFFRLNTEVSLLLTRRRTIRYMWRHLEDLRTASTPADRASAEHEVNQFKARSAPQALCARSFQRLYDADWNKAEEIYKQARLHLDSVGDPVPA